MPAKLSQEKIEEVYLLYLSGRYTREEIMDLCGVSRGAYYNIINGYKEAQNETCK